MEEFNAIEAARTLVSNAWYEVYKKTPRFELALDKLISIERYLIAQQKALFS